MAPPAGTRFKRIYVQAEVGFRRLMSPSRVKYLSGQFKHLSCWGRPKLKLSSFATPCSVKCVHLVAVQTSQLLLHSAGR